MKKHLLICERDAGLFSLIQQVISNIPRALHEGAVPIVHFGPRCCYWTPAGHRGRSTVWEYYFKPLVAGHDSASIPAEVEGLLQDNFPPSDQSGVTLTPAYDASCHFGDHPDLRDKSLVIPYMWHDPDRRTRRQASRIIAAYLRPRSYLAAGADAFYDAHLTGHPVIGVHLRGTDALSQAEWRLFRRGSLRLERYLKPIRRQLQRWPEARLFVATDEERSLQFIRAAFGPRVVAYESLRHHAGEVVGTGPLGGLLPQYIAQDRALAAQNGEEAVIEYLILCRCDYLVHNGASLARTVLLTHPQLAHYNTHWRRLLSRIRSCYPGQIGYYLEYKLRPNRHLKAWD